MYLNEERARGLMADFGFDVIIASTPENLTYLAGTVGWSNKVYAYSVHMFAVFARDEGTAPAIIVPGQEVTYVSAQQSWIKDLYTFGGKSALIQPAGSASPDARGRNLPRHVQRRRQTRQEPGRCLGPCAQGTRPHESAPGARSGARDAERARTD